MLKIPLIMRYVYVSKETHILLYRQTTDNVEGDQQIDNINVRIHE